MSENATETTPIEAAPAIAEAPKKAKSETRASGFYFRRYWH